MAQNAGDAEVVGEIPSQAPPPEVLGKAQAEYLIGFSLSLSGARGDRARDPGACGGLGAALCGSVCAGGVASKMPLALKALPGVVLGAGASAETGGLSQGKRGWWPLHAVARHRWPPERGLSAKSRLRRCLSQAILSWRTRPRARRGRFWALNMWPGQGQGQGPAAAQGQAAAEGLRGA